MQRVSAALNLLRGHVLYDFLILGNQRVPDRFEHTIDAFADDVHVDSFQPTKRAICCFNAMAAFGCRITMMSLPAWSKVAAVANSQ